MEQLVASNRPRVQIVNRNQKFEISQALVNNLGNFSGLGSRRFGALFLTEPAIAEDARIYIYRSRISG